MTVAIGLQYWCHFLASTQHPNPEFLNCHSALSCLYMCLCISICFLNIMHTNINTISLLHCKCGMFFKYRIVIHNGLTFDPLPPNFLVKNYVVHLLCEEKCRKKYRNWHRDNMNSIIIDKAEDGHWWLQSIYYVEWHTVAPKCIRTPTLLHVI